MKKTIKIPWNDFVDFGLHRLRQKYPISQNALPKFMISHGTEPDAENYSIPDYVEIEID